jgi:hypothetical protein
VLTAALKRCATQSRTPMEFFRKLLGCKPSGFEQRKLNADIYHLHG